MGDRVGLVVPCSTCGPIALDPALVEVHRDRVHGFSLATYLCLGCGQVGASRSPDVLAAARGAAVPERRLTCTSPPSVADA